MMRKLDKRVTQRFNLEKSITGELDEITKIIQSKEEESIKLESVQAILSDLAEEIMEARADKLYEERTGFLGPKFGEDFLAKEIEVCTRYKKNFSVGLLDIDFLKYINDHYGHVAGTKAIMTVAAAIKKCLRAADVVSRYGGDEFLIIFTDTAKEKAEIVMPRIKAEIDRRSEKNEFKIGVSYGLAEFDFTKKLTATELIEQADKELYRAKQNRGNPNV